MGDTTGQHEGEPEVIDTEGVTTEETTNPVSDNPQYAEVMDNSAQREAQEEKEAQEEMKKLQAEVAAAMDVANQMMSTGEEVLKVVEGNSYMSKAFDKSVALFDDYVIQTAIQPIWNNAVPDEAKIAMTYVPSTTPDVFAAAGNSLVQAGFIEVPGVDAAEMVKNQQKLISLAAKYGQYIDPQLKVVGYLERMAGYIGKKKDELFYAKVRASLAKHRAANNNSQVAAAA